MQECHADNEFNLARFPGIDPYVSLNHARLPDMPSPR